MADTEPKVVSWLRAYAERRRAMASSPLELHPANRRLLQQQVRETWGRSEGKRSSPDRGLAWWAFWPRYIFGSVLMAVTILAAFLWLPGPGPTPGPATHLAEVKGATSSMAQLESPPAAVPLPTPVRPTPEPLIERGPATTVTASRPTPVAAAPALAASPPSAVLVTGRSAVDAAAVPARQQQLQGSLWSNQAPAYRRNLNSPAPSPVLTSFRLEQDGDRVTITDADGSVYHGRLLAVDAGPAAGREKSSTPVARREPQASQAMRYGLAQTASPAVPPAAPSLTSLAGFKVEGTNVSLGKPLVFEGHYLAEGDATAQFQNAANLMTPQSAESLTNQLFLNNQAQAASFQGVIIQGQVNIAGRTQLFINAVPAER